MTLKSEIKTKKKAIKEHGSWSAANSGKNLSLVELVRQLGNIAKDQTMVDASEKSVAVSISKLHKDVLGQLVMRLLPGAAATDATMAKLDVMTKNISSLSSKLDEKSYAQATRSSSYLKTNTHPNISNSTPRERQYGQIDFMVDNKKKSLPEIFEELVKSGLAGVNVKALKFKRRSDTRATLLFSPESERVKVVEYFKTFRTTNGLKLRPNEVKLVVHTVPKETEEGSFGETKKALIAGNLCTTHCRWLKAANFKNNKSHLSLVVSFDAYSSDMAKLSEIRRSGQIVIGDEIFNVAVYKDTPPSTPDVSMSPTERR